MKDIYLCNGKVPYCRKTSCYLNGGLCGHTTNEVYALNPPDERVFDDGDIALKYGVRFEKEADDV